MMAAHAPPDSPAGTLVLRLYIAGTTARSKRAVENVRNLCEQHLKGRYDLEVIDLYQQPELAAREQLLAAPTLIKKLPLPLRRLVGDLSDHARVLAGLDVVPRAS
jgi:circadian clock protein KaiB